MHLLCGTRAIYQTSNLKMKHAVVKNAAVIAFRYGIFCLPVPLIRHMFSLSSFRPENTKGLNDKLVKFHINVHDGKPFRQRWFINFHETILFIKPLRRDKLFRGSQPYFFQMSLS